MTLLIQTRDLTKRFPKAGGLAGLRLPFAREPGTLAVDRVNLEVAQGEIFGLVGPNGAGKTTLVKMLATLILPTSGTARVNGYALCTRNERLIKASIGLLTGNERSFFPRLSCCENLQFYAGLHDLSRTETQRRIRELSKLLDLGEFLEKRYDTCSTGMKHRLALARSLVNDPQLLLLDEPTRSLDPLAAARFRQAVCALANQKGRTILLVTHDLAEADELCDRVGVMLQGRVRVTDDSRNLRQLLRPHEACSLRIRGCLPGMLDALGRLEDVDHLTEQVTSGDLASVKLFLRDRKRGLPAVTRVIAQEGGTVEELRFEAPSWEEAFASLDRGPSSQAESDPATLRTGGPVPADGDASSDRSGKAARGTRGPRRLVRILRRAFLKPMLFFRRDLKTQVSYRFSFLLQFLGILFSSASFYFVAQLLGANATPMLANYGGDYFSFVLIGIAFVGYQGVALYTFSGVIRSAQTAGTLESMLATPTRLATILFSSSLWSFAFTSLRVVVYLLAGATVFGADLGQANVLGAAVILVLTVLTLSSIGILSACFIMIFKRGSPVNFLIGSLSSLLAGVYYPVEVLPGWLQQLARLFPLTYSLEAMRRALLTGEGLVRLATPVAALAAFTVLLLPLSLMAFRHAVRQAKRDGSLTQF